MVEKNGEEDIGGRLNELVMDGGFRFDTGENARTYVGKSWLM